MAFVRAPQPYTQPVSLASSAGLVAHVADTFGRLRRGAFASEAIAAIHLLQLRVHSRHMRCIGARA